jgi:cholesterol transport system auxiliary component
MIPLFQRAAIAACVVALAACSILPKSEPVTVYRLPVLTAADTPAAVSTGNLRALRVATPNANRTIDSERILVLREPDVIKSYAGVRWSDPAPVLLRDRLLERFNLDGRFARLSGDNSNIAADIELNGGLTAFQSEYRGGVATIIIQYDARLLETSTRQQIAARRFSVTLPVAGVQIPEVVAAFGAAVNSLSGDVVAWAATLPDTRVAAPR